MLLAQSKFKNLVLTKLMTGFCKRLSIMTTDRLCSGWKISILYYFAGGNMMFNMWFSPVENPLLKMIHETGAGTPEEVSLEHLEKVPAMWCYRTRVTIEHLTQVLNEKRAASKKHTILELFLQRVSNLRELPTTCCLNMGKLIIFNPMFQISLPRLRLYKISNWNLCELNEVFSWTELWE